MGADLLHCLAAGWGSPACLSPSQRTVNPPAGSPDVLMGSLWAAFQEGRSEQGKTSEGQVPERITSATCCGSEQVTGQTRFKGSEGKCFPRIQGVAKRFRQFLIFRTFCWPKKATAKPWMVSVGQCVLPTIGERGANCQRAIQTPCQGRGKLGFAAHGDGDLSPDSAQLGRWGWGRTQPPWMSICLPAARG